MRRSFGWMLALAMAVSAVAVCGSAAQASVTGDSISIAFARDEPAGTPGCALDPKDIAGAPGYQSANWVNEFGNASTDSNLTRDTNGVAKATNASVTWSSNNTWATEARGDNYYNLFPGADETLMTGYLDSSDLGTGNYLDITITGLPDDMAAGYSVVVYTLSPVVGRAAVYFANDPAQANPKYVVVGGTTTYKHPYGGPNYVQAAGTDPDFGSSGSTDDFGNFIVFTGLSGNTVTIHAEPRDFRVVLNAVQVVKNP